MDFCQIIYLSIRVILQRVQAAEHRKRVLLGYFGLLL